MKLSRVDLGPLAAIAIGGTLGSMVITSALDDGEHIVRHEIVHVQTTADVTAEATATVTVEATPEWNEDGSRVVFRHAPIRVTGGEGSRIRIRGQAVSMSDDPQPLIYVDGVRLEGNASVEDIEPTTIDRIEIVKGEAAQELFGDEATGGVVQIYLKEVVESPDGYWIPYEGEPAPDHIVFQTDEGLHIEGIADNAVRPLIYVDGVRMEGPDLDEIHPDMIDRVEVLKGEEAIERYGPEAANGVIIIIRKRKKRR